MMRAFLAACTIGVAAAALLPAGPAHAWYDAYGRWHQDYYRPPGYAAPPPPAYYARPYAPPEARWVPPHYDRFGRFVPGRYF